MSSDNKTKDKNEDEKVEMKDGFRVRKLAELKTEAAEQYEQAMLKRVEYYKKQNEKKSGFNSTLQNTFFKTFASILDLKLNIDKAIGEENLKKVHKTIDEILLFGL
jgi:triphosphoribosyl-dephospho-CoA synthetase